MTINSMKFLLLVAAFLCINGCFWEETEHDPENLPLNDTAYPYAGLPRIVIETEDFHEIRDRETEIPSHLQIYGESGPDSDVMSLTVRGRGNSSLKMPKYGMKLEFDKKVSLFDMPKNRDWVLIANFGDKTHLRNFMMYRISEWLGAKYTPKMQFVEVYLNRKYIGLYLLSENVKVGKNRVNIPENDSTFLFEKEDEKKVDPPYITTKRDNMFHIKSPKNPSQESMDLLLNHLNDFETYLKERKYLTERPMIDWLDVPDYMIYYWVQEFSKNEDGNFARSIYMTWEKGGTIHFGPLWDFDLGFGNASREYNKTFEEWYIRNYNWNAWILRDRDMSTAAKHYWNEFRPKFKELIDSIPLYAKNISAAVKNEYKRWPIIQNTENWALKDPYDSYDEALDAMIQWMRGRMNWIDENISRF